MPKSFSLIREYFRIYQYPGYWLQNLTRKKIIRLSIWSWLHPSPSRGWPSGWVGVLAHSRLGHSLWYQGFGFQGWQWSEVYTLPPSSSCKEWAPQAVEWCTMEVVSSCLWTRLVSSGWEVENQTLSPGVPCDVTYVGVSFLKIFLRLPASGRCLYYLAITYQQ